MKYTNIKSSNVEWLGDIPSHWEIKRGKNCLTLLSRPVLDDDDIITCFRDGEVTLRKNRREEGFTNALLEIGYQGVNAGDLVVHGMDGFAGAIGISDSRGKASPVLNVMDSPNCKRFLMYYLRSLANKEVFLSLSTGIRVRSCDLRWNKLAVLPFILPPLPEQTAIAAYLDEKCRTIDEIIAEAKASIEEYKAWKSSVIFEAVTKGLDPHAEMKDSGVEWIGKVPRHWKMTKTKFCSSKIGSGKTPRGGAEIYADSGVMILRSQNIYNTGLMLDNVSYISEEIDNEMANSRVFEDDILLNITGGSIGRCCIYPANFPHANVNQHVCIIRVIKDIMIPKLMLYIWMSDVGQKSIDICQTGANREGMNFEQIGNTIIPMMAYTEQQAIVNYLDEKCAAIDGIIAEKEDLIADMEAYKKSLVFETVTGKRKVC